MADCFVIMGFGKKTDYGKKARTLDLDATYRAIIKPAVEDCGLRCIRADEVTHSGIIDLRMYELLLRADLVIADISTANANALYELGVRHALRPYRTIIMKEEEGKFHFDLNHLATLQYRHLGEDIGTSEATKKRVELATMVRAVMNGEDTDSPVFVHLKALGLEAMTEAALRRESRRAEASSDTLGAIIEAGRMAAAESDHVSAAAQFRRAFDLQTASLPDGTPGTADPFVLQQLALATYKAKQPSEVEALELGWSWIARLSPAESTDPETLGIAGAIQKRLFQKLKTPAHLNRAVELYGRGFEVKRDYYNGENYALCLDLRAKESESTSPTDASYDRETARRVRARVYDLLLAAFSDPTTLERADYKWMLATMANVLYSQGKVDEGSSFEQRFRDLPLANWEVDTFEGGKKYAEEIPRTAGV